MENIVVGVDESKGAAEALRWAVREGKLRGLPVTAVLAWGWLDQHYAPGPEADEAAEGDRGVFDRARFDHDYGEGDAAQALESIVRLVLGTVAAADVKCKVTCQLPAPALLEAADGASMLVVGARGLGGFKELLLGSVSQQCLHHARCPVAVIRASGEGAESAAGSETSATVPSAGRIVVAIDDSATTQHALDWALDEGRLRRVEVDVVHAWSTPYIGASPFAPVLLDPLVFEASAQAVVDAAVAAADTSGLTVGKLVKCGDAASVILEAADGAELVVLGSRGRGGFMGLILGSVSHQVTHHFDGSVLVVPSR
jgi:nucleotide-binding universal stress UspA family protein